MYWIDSKAFWGLAWWWSQGWRQWYPLQSAGLPAPQLPLPLYGMRVCDSGAQHGLASLACLLHCECGVEQPSWRTATCLLSVTWSQSPSALVVTVWDGEEGWWMCYSNIWIFTQNVDAWMSYCKGMKSGHARSFYKCVPICTLAWKWGCYFQWGFTQCQLRYLCTLLHSEHRRAFTL